MDWLDNTIKLEKIILNGKTIINIPVQLTALDLIMIAHGEVVQFISDTIGEKNIKLKITVKKN